MASNLVASLLLVVFPYEKQMKSQAETRAPHGGAATWLALRLEPDKTRRSGLTAANRPFQHSGTSPIRWDEHG